MKITSSNTFREVFLKTIILSVLFICTFLIPQAVLAAPRIDYKTGFYDISTAKFISIAKSVSAQETSPQSMIFNNTGTRLYVMGSSGRDINQYNLTVPYDISTATFSSIVLSVLAQESIPTSMLFNNTGTRLYVLGSSGDDIDQYNLGTAYDISTATFSSVALDVGAQETFPTDMLFNNNGTKLYILGSDDDQINQYTLSTPYNISTATFNSVALSVSGQEGVPNDMIFNSDGTKLYVTGGSGDDVNQYNLSTAYDISTAVFGGIAKSVSSQEGVPRSMLFNDIGSKFFLLGAEDAEINQYTLETLNVNFSETSLNDGSVEGQLGFTLSGDTFNDSDNNGLLTACGGAVVCVGHQVQITNLPAGLTPTVTLYKADGVTSNTTDNAPIGILTLTGNATSHQNVNDIANLTFTFANSAFNTSTAASVTNAVAGSASTGIDYAHNFTPRIDYKSGFYNVSSASFNAGFSVAGQETSPTDFLFNEDGTSIYILGVIGDDINKYNLSTPYDISTATFDSIALSVTAQEINANDMVFNRTGTVLYVMGTTGDDINKYNLSTPYDISTATFDSIALSVASQESSPYSLMFNNTGTRLYVMGASGDDINQYNLGTAYDISTATFSSVVLSVAAKETNPHDMMFSNDGMKLYILGSSPTIGINQYNLSTAYDISTASFNSFPLLVSSQDISPTSMGFDNTGSRLFVLGGGSDNISQYNLGTSNVSFVEAVANDGSVTGQLSFNLSFDSFNDPDNNSLLSVCGGAVACAGHQVEITNLPAGLTPTMTLYKADGTTNTTDNANIGILTLSGNATSHQNANDIANLTFTFADSAFNSTVAAGVTNAVAASATTGIDFTDNSGTYTVTYDGNTNTGGSVPTDASSPYGTGATVTVLGNSGSLVKAGSVFNNWNTAANGSGTTYAPAATFTINADTTLYAQWLVLPTIAVTMVDNLTNESGGTGTFTVVLGSAPTANVTIDLSSSNVAEGTVPASVTFTTLNWNVPQTITITGVEDVISDGSQDFNIITGNVTSADLNYNALDGSTISDLVFTNQDNDAPGIVLTPISTTTTEAGGTVTIQVNLLSQPAGGADVTIPLSVSDATEGSVSASITILNANWNTPGSNVITVTGVDDVLTDGNIIYSLVTGDPTSVDPAYDAFTAAMLADVSLTNNDNEVTTYTVIYDGNTNTGGTVPVDGSSPYITGSTVTVLGNTGTLVKTGYSFGNWNTAADGSGISYTPASTFSISANIILYAQWDLLPATYTVTYNGNTNTGGSAPVDGSSPYNTGSTVTILGNSGTLVKTGATFDNWNTKANGTGIDYAPGNTFSISTNTIIYAKWSDTTPPTDPTVGAITPNPANTGDIVTLSLTNVEEGATVTIPGFVCSPIPTTVTGNVSCTATAGTGYDGGAKTISVTDAFGNANTNTTTPVIVINTTTTTTTSSGGGVVIPVQQYHNGTTYIQTGNTNLQKKSLANLLGGEEPNVPKEFSDYVCKRYMKEYILPGASNNPVEVKKLQEFLNISEGEKLVVDGTYDADDIEAVKRFQTKYKDQIMSPWGLTEATGRVLRTTTAKINILLCATKQGCPYFDSYLKEGDTSVDSVKVQDFLNIIFAPISGYPTNGLELSKEFNGKTKTTVKDFQTVYKEIVLKPWGLTSATGWWYKTTRHAANKLMNCAEGEIVLDNGAKVE